MSRVVFLLVARPTPHRARSDGDKILRGEKEGPARHGVHYKWDERTRVCANDSTVLASHFMSLRFGTIDFKMERIKCTRDEIPTCMMIPLLI